MSAMQLTPRQAVWLVILVLGFAVGMASLLNGFKFNASLRSLQEARILQVSTTIQRALQKNFTFSSVLAENESAEVLIERHLAADPLIVGIDILDPAGVMVFSTDPARRGQLAPAAWQAAGRRALQPTWWRQEPDVFVSGLNVINSFGVQVACVVVRYQRAAFDARAAVMGRELLVGAGQVWAVAALLAAVLLPWLFKRRGAGAP